MGEGEFRVELREREPGATGADEAVFLIRPERRACRSRPSPRRPPAASSRASRSRSRPSGGGETMVFDEIDAGIGGTTAHARRRDAARLASAPR